MQPTPVDVVGAEATTQLLTVANMNGHRHISAARVPPNHLAKLLLNLCELLMLKYHPYRQMAPNTTEHTNLLMLLTCAHRLAHAMPEQSAAWRGMHLTDGWALSVSAAEYTVSMHNSLCPVSPAARLLRSPVRRLLVTLCGYTCCCCCKTMLGSGHQ